MAKSKAVSAELKSLEATAPVSVEDVAQYDAMLLAPDEQPDGEMVQTFTTPFGAYELSTWVDMDEPRVELTFKSKDEDITIETWDDYDLAVTKLREDVARRLNALITAAQGISAFMTTTPEPFSVSVVAPYPVSAATDSRVKRYGQGDLTLNFSNRGKRWTNEDRALLAEGFVAGASMQALVDHFGRSPASLMLALADLGLVAADHPYASLRATS